MSDTLSPRAQMLLRALPGAVLLVFATVGGIWAMANHNTEYSSLDNRDLAEFEYPTKSGILDKSWMDSFDSFVDDRLPGRDTWLETHAATVTRALHNPFLNDVYVGAASGHLLEKPLNQPYRDTLPEEAQGLADAASDAGSELLWVYAPKREEAFADELPQAWNNPFVERRADIVAALGSTGAPVLDLTEELSEPAARDDYFYRTDHHWAPPGAQLATERIVEQLAAQGVKLGQDDRNYSAVVGPEGFVGSIGRKVTLGATDAEPFVYDAPDDGWRARVCNTDGCLQPTLDTAIANDADTYANRYEAFLGGDRGLTHIYNPDPAATGTVMLVKDSYGNAVATYLAERVKNLYVIDERHYDGEPLGQLMVEKSADAVVVLHNQVSLLSQAFASDVWLDAAIGQGELAHPIDAASAEVAAYADAQVVSEQGLVLSRKADQPLDDSLGADARALSEAIADTATPMAWFYVPRKEEAYADLLTADFGNPLEKKRATVLAYLDVGDPLVDLTSVFANPDFRDRYYYRTDHHPTWEGATVISDALVLELESMGVRVGPPVIATEVAGASLPFFGSQMGGLPDGVVIPGDDLEWREPAGGWNSRLCDADECETAPIFSSWLDDPRWDANRYKAFLGQGFDTVHLHNDSPGATGTVVMLKDSFSHLAAIQLAERVEDLYLVDERGTDAQTVPDLVEQVGADAVLVVHNQESLLSSAFDREKWRGAQVD